MKQLNDGQTVYDIIRNLVGSKEFRDATAAQNTATAKARMLYARILAREPDDSGLTATVDYINKHGAEKAAFEMLGSPEYTERFETNAVPAALGKKVKARCQQ